MPAALLRAVSFDRHAQEKPIKKKPGLKAGFL